jgi:hypothetical protein
MGRVCSTNGEKRDACKLVVEKLERTRPLGTPILRWVNKVEVDPK